MREVINNQMQTYEDWLKDQLGIADQIEPCEPENLTKNEKEKVKKKEEPVWLDCNFNGNPYKWWKFLLEKEKRRIEKGERDKNYDKERRSENKESGSRGSGSRNYYTEDKDGKRKYGHNQHDRYYKQNSKSYKSGNEFNCLERQRSERKREELDEHKDSRRGEVRHEYNERERCKSVNKYDSRESYKVSKRKRSHHDQANGSKSQKESYNNNERQHDSKGEVDQESNRERQYSKKHKASGIVKLKQQSKGDRESGTDSSSSQSRKSRRKKSKKKHSHKHKSKKKKKRKDSSEKYNPMTSTDESSTE